MISRPPRSTLFPYNDALPIFIEADVGQQACQQRLVDGLRGGGGVVGRQVHVPGHVAQLRSEEHTAELQSRGHLVCRLLPEKKKTRPSHTNTTKQTTEKQRVDR